MALCNGDACYPIRIDAVLCARFVCYNYTCAGQLNANEPHHAPFLVISLWQSLFCFRYSTFSISFDSFVRLHTICELWCHVCARSVRILPFSIENLNDTNMPIGDTHVFWILIWKINKTQNAKRVLVVLFLHRKQIGRFRFANIFHL